MTDGTVYRIENRVPGARGSDRPVFYLTPQSEPGMPQVNVELLRAALEWVTEHPETHDQDTWLGWRSSRSTYTADQAVLEYVIGRLAQAGTDRVPALADTACGTAGCLFGWAVVIDGRYTSVRLSPHGEAVVECVLPDAVPYGADWETVGRRVLGLTEANADALSYGDNSTGDLWRMASVITAGAIEVPERFADYDGIREGALVHLGRDDCANTWE